MKELIENKWWVGLLILLLYIIVDVADARWFIPRLSGKCSGGLTEQQEEQCFHWYYSKKKE